MSINVRRSRAALVLIALAVAAPVVAASITAAGASDGLSTGSSNPGFRCAAANLHQAPRGSSIRIHADLAGVHAMLTGTSRRPSPRRAEPGDALLRHGRLVVTDQVGDRESYRLPTNRYYHPKAEYITKVSARGGGGYLCLVQFQPDDPPVAVIAVNPECMGACPRLEFVPSDGQRRSKQIGQAGFTFVPADGTVLDASDARFFGEFGDAADSLEPLRIMTLANGRLVAVTARFPKRLSRDTNRAYRLFNQPTNGPHDGLGALAAWAADECTGGHQHHAFRKVDALAAAGRLKGGRDSAGGHRYIRHLKSFLRSSGYAT